MQGTFSLIKSCKDTLSPETFSNLLLCLTKKERNLYKNIREGMPEEEAVKHDYSTLKKKLLDAQIINESGNNIQIEKKRLFKKRLLVEDLLLCDRSNMIIVAMSCLEDAKGLGVHNVAADMCRILSLHYMQYERRIDLALDYREKTELYTDKYNEEMKAEWIFAQAVNVYEGVGECKVNIPLANKIKSMKDGIDLSKDSSRLHLFWYSIAALEASLRGDLEGKVSICKKAIEYFTALHYRHDLAIGVFRRNLVCTYREIGTPHYLALAENIIRFDMDQEGKTEHEVLRMTCELVDIKKKLGRDRDPLDLIQTIDCKKLSSQDKRERVLLDMMELQMKVGTEEVKTIRVAS